jgi:putative membrane protein
MPIAMEKVMRLNWILENRFVTAFALLVSLAALPGLASPRSASGDAHAAQGDGEILAALVALDQNEVEAAKLAEKNSDGAVLGYARMLREDHEANLDDSRKLGDKLNLDLKKTEAVDKMKDQGDKLIDRLDDLKGSEFERSFISEMVSGHRDALHQIDAWLKDVQNPQLKQHLHATRERVAFHLKDAERLQGTMH